MLFPPRLRGGGSPLPTNTTSPCPSADSFVVLVARAGCCGACLHSGQGMGGRGYWEWVSGVGGASSLCGSGSRIDGVFNYSIAASRPNYRATHWMQKRSRTRREQQRERGCWWASCTRCVTADQYPGPRRRRPPPARPYHGPLMRVTLGLALNLYLPPTTPPLPPLPSCDGFFVRGRALLLLYVLAGGR